MADSGSTGGVVQAPDGPRVLFVGVGTFIMLLVLGISTLIAIIGRGTRTPVLFYLLAIVLFALVLGFLLLAPRESALTTAASQARLTSSYVAGLALMATMSAVAVAAAAVGVFTYGCLGRVKAEIIDDDL